MLGYNAKLDKVKNVVIYLRKSRQGEGMETEETLSTHRKILTELANKNNWKFEIFEEVASSIDMDIRTELTKMLRKVEKAMYDAVLVMDVDRLSRSVKDSAIIKAIFAENNVLIITADMSVIDLNHDNDSLISDFMDVVSSYEYKQIRKRMMRGKRAGAQEGKWNNGNAPLGYVINKEKKTLEIIDTEARIVRLIFQWTIEQKGATWIRDELNKYGLRTKNKRHFSEVAIRRIIKNETYKGWLIRHRIKWTGSKKEIHDKDNWVIVKNAVPNIISEDEWDLANLELNKRSTEPSRTKAKTFGLSGVLKCGYCGYTLTFRNRNDRKTDKILRGCHHKFEDGSICDNQGTSYYEIVTNVINDLRDYRTILTEKFIILEINKEGSKNDKEIKINAIIEQISKNKRSLEKVDIAWEEDIIDIAEYKEKRKKLLDEKEILELERSIVNKEMQKSEVDHVKNLMVKLDTFLNNYEELSERDFNIQIKAFINKIEYYNGKNEELPRLKFYYVE